MKITGTIQGKLGPYATKWYESTKERMRTVTFSVEVTHEECEEHFGKDFTDRAFHGMINGDDVEVKSKKMSCSLNSHRLTILKQKMSAKPEITDVKSVKDEDAIIVVVIFPLPCGPALGDFHARLTDACGTTVRIAVEEEQVPVPGAEGGKGQMEIVPKGAGRPKGSHGPKRRPAQ